MTDEQSKPSDESVPLFTALTEWPCDWEKMVGTKHNETMVRRGRCKHCGHDYEVIGDGSHVFPCETCGREVWAKPTIGHALRSLMMSDELLSFDDVIQSPRKQGEEA